MAMMIMYVNVYILNRQALIDICTILTFIAHEHTSDCHSLLFPLI